MKADIKTIQDFNKWMIKKVQSIHYSDNEKMYRAYERLIPKHK